MDSPQFTAPLTVNVDFSRLAENKTISYKRVGIVTFFELERLESSANSLLEANAFSLWLLSGLLSRLKRDGSSPSDPALFDFAISSLSTLLSGQTRVAAALSDFFFISDCRESFLGHASLPLSVAQNSPGSGSDLFSQGLLEKVSGQVKEDSFILSSLSKLPRS